MIEGDDESWQCVYCNSCVPQKERTVDHVIARSWYPNNNYNGPKWKVPSCAECNNKYSYIEGVLLTKIALCMDCDRDDSLREIVDKTKRSIDPRHASSDRDLVKRFNARQRLQHSLVPVQSSDARGMLPAFSDNYEKGSRTGVLIPADMLRGTVKKWIRGVHFCELGKRIPNSWKIDTYFVNDDVASNAFSEIESNATRIQKGPGVEVLIWNVSEGDMFMAQYAFNIWNSFRVYGSVQNFND